MAAAAEETAYVAVDIGDDILIVVNGQGIGTVGILVVGIGGGACEEG